MLKHELQTRDSRNGKRLRVDVLCLTYGEPSDTRWTPQFRYSLAILNRLTRRVAPIPKFITPLLAARRGLVRSKTFRKIGYASPLEDITRKQVDGVARCLAQKRPDWEFRVHCVCEFRPPFIWEFLEPMRADPPDEIVVLPLYVAESDFTSGISRTDLAAFHAKHGGAHGLPDPRYCKGFGFDERLGKIFADFTWRQCGQAGWTPERCSRAVLILGAHGTLQFPPPGINSSARETRFFFGLVRKHLLGRFRSIRIGWLNHKIGGRWTFPEVAEAARESRNQGIRGVVYFPFGFMADNAESQLEGPNQLREFEWEDSLFLPCVNDAPEFLDYLADCVTERLDGPREPWGRIEQEATQWLIQKERPAPTGRAGFLRFRGPGLGILAGAVWFAVAVFLVVRGAGYLLRVEQPLFQGLDVAVALALGYLKGKTVIARLAKKNLARLRRLPQPSPIHRMFGGSTWLLMVFFAGLAVAIRTLGLPNGLRATILIAVGLALLIGSVLCMRHLHLASPAEEPAEGEAGRALSGKDGA